MLKNFTVLFFVTLFALAAHAQNNNDAKAKQLEEMRRLKEQMMQEQKTIQQQNEWNNQSSQQEIKKLNQENQQKNMEIAVTRQQAQRAKSEAVQAKNELEAKQEELRATQARIDSAKALLSQTEELLMTSEMQKKRIAERLQFQEDSVKILKKEQEVQDLQLQAQKAKINLYIIVAAISLSLLSIIGVLFMARHKTLRELEEKNRLVNEEKRRSDELLLNILPEEVMHELKAHGKTTAKNYSKATVLFADIRDFTSISEKLSPSDLVEGLDAYFERFDKVIEKYDIEKIKTIGDAYVCAGGVPTKSEGNPHLVVQAALDFAYEIEKLKRERTAQGKIPFEFRIGIHTGQLVAGVIGIRKFAYDIWGDTVNMAARMQQAGEIGKINISGGTYELVKDKFACVYRGKVEAKNKGEVDMYFVQKAL